MKKALVSALFIFFLFSLFGCGAKEGFDSSSAANASSKQIESSSNSQSSLSTGFSKTVTYDEENSCTLITSADDQMKMIGTCNFDGSDPKTETLRSLAFTTYCIENASVFCDGNLTMLYYSGDNDGFAYYENGELTMSDFPDQWNQYASNITQEEIEQELKNIIDNIE